MPVLSILRRMLPVAAALSLVPAVASAGEGGGPLAAAVLFEREVVHSPSSTLVRQSWSGPAGRGADRLRTTTRAPGSIDTAVSRSYANGASAESSRSWTRDGEGTATRARSHTGVAGNTRSDWTTLYRSEEGFGRSRGFSSSSGRGGSRATDVAVGEETVTVNRSARTNSGRSRSSSRTFDRR